MLDLLRDNNLPQFLLCFFPILIYAILIYLTLPKGSVSIRSCTLYFFLGFLAAQGVMIFNNIFPNWHSTPIYRDDLNISLLLFAIIQVGLLEESMKLLCFWLSEKYRETKEKLTPVGIMFLCICVSCGFAVCEDLDYLNQMSHVLWVRAFSALIGHMLFGGVSGYFLGVLYIKKAEIWFRKLPYLIAAIVLSALIHGLYDYAFMSKTDDFPAQFGGAMTILLFGSFVVYLMRVDLERREKEL